MRIIFLLILLMFRFMFWLLRFIGLTLIIGDVTNTTHRYRTAQRYRTTRHFR